MISPEIAVYGIYHSGNWYSPWNKVLIQEHLLRFIRLSVIKQRYKKVAIMYAEHFFEPLGEGKVFDRYKNIIISPLGQFGSLLPHVVVEQSFKEAIENSRSEVVFVLGGEDLWQEAMKEADEIIITKVPQEIRVIGEIYTFPQFLNVPLYSSLHRTGGLFHMEGEYILETNFYEKVPRLVKPHGYWWSQRGG